MMFFAQLQPEKQQSKFVHISFRLHARVITIAIAATAARQLGGGGPATAKQAGVLQDLTARPNWGCIRVRDVIRSMFTPSTQLCYVDASPRLLYQLVQQAKTSNDAAMYEAVSGDFEWFVAVCLPRHNLLA